MDPEFCVIKTDDGAPRGLVVRRAGLHQVWNWTRKQWTSTVWVNGLHGECDEVSEAEARAVAEDLGIPWTWSEALTTQG